MYVPGRLHIGLFECEVLKNFIKAFSNKIMLNIFYEKNERFALVSIHKSRPFYSGLVKRIFLPYIEPVTYDYFS